MYWYVSNIQIYRPFFMLSPGLFLSLCVLNLSFSSIKCKPARLQKGPVLTIRLLMDSVSAIKRNLKARNTIPKNLLCKVSLLSNILLCWHEFILFLGFSCNACCCCYLHEWKWGIRRNSFHRGDWNLFDEKKCLT